MRASTAVGYCALLALASEGLGCASYRSALGFRAREAARAGDVGAFQALMAEAATTLPRHPLDNPKRTVLTHFLDLGGSDRFRPTIEEWRERGWVEDAATCSIERARWRGVAGRDLEEADRAADTCVERARDAAEDPARSWELQACLAEAPFLVLSSTSAVARFVAIAADPAEPAALRVALLDGLTHLFLSEPAQLRESDGQLTESRARALAVGKLHATRARFLALLGDVRATTDTSLLARGTAFGALELERVSLALDEPFFEALLAHGGADDADLVWAWVRTMKEGPRFSRLDRLGLYDRRREPHDDAYWYACARQLIPLGEASETIVVKGAALGAPSPCPSRPGQSVLGAFPLEATALGAAAAILRSTQSKS